MKKTDHKPLNTAQMYEKNPSLWTSNTAQKASILHTRGGGREVPFWALVFIAKRKKSQTQ